MLWTLAISFPFLFVPVFARNAAKIKLLLDSGDAEAALALLLERRYNESKNQKAHWLLFQTYRKLKRFEHAHDHGLRAMELAHDDRKPLLSEFIRFLVGVNWNHTEIKKICLTELGEKPHDDAIRHITLRCLLDLPDPDVKLLKHESAPLMNIMRHLPIEDSASHRRAHQLLGNLNAAVGSLDEAMKHLGLACRAGRSPDNKNRRLPFSEQISTAYAKTSATESLPQVPVDSAPPVFMSELPFRPEILARLRDFFRFSPNFFPAEHYGHFIGYLFDPFAAPTSLIDESVAAMHRNLPADLRAFARYATWWSHITPYKPLTGAGHIHGHECHADDQDGNADGLAMSTSVLYLVNDTAATLVTNQSRFALKHEPVAWVMHPRESMSATFPSSWEHCVLPGNGITESPLRVSINVIWLSDKCKHNETTKHCLHRPTSGWTWEREIPPEEVLQAGSTRIESIWVPQPLIAFEPKREEL